MIKNYDRYTETEYRNIFQVVWIFLVVEYHEILAYLNIFNPITTEYEKRKHWWFILGLIALAMVMLSILTIAVGVSILAINSIM